MNGPAQEMLGARETVAAVPASTKEGPGPFGPGLRDSVRALKLVHPTHAAAMRHLGRVLFLLGNL